MDFKNKNNVLRRFYYEQDLSPMSELLRRIRVSLTAGNEIDLENLDLSGFINFDKNLTQITIFIFQEFQSPIKVSGCLKSLKTTLNYLISNIRNLPNFKSFEIENSEKCRIMIDYLIEQNSVEIKNITAKDFGNNRFEAGITGIKVISKDKCSYYSPVEAYIDGEDCFDNIQKKLQISGVPADEFTLYLTYSRNFITYKNDVLNLYRGNTLYKYSPQEIKEQMLNVTNWVVENMPSEDRFYEFYDLKNDCFSENFLEDEIVYCDLINIFINAYKLTKEKKYLNVAQRTVKYVLSLLQSSEEGQYLSSKIYSQLESTGIVLATLIKYRHESNDKVNDEYIIKLAKYIISKITVKGEMLKDAKFSDDIDDFYYSGGALLGLALFANYFDSDEILKAQVIEKLDVVLNRIRTELAKDDESSIFVNVKLMQAIEELCNNKYFAQDKNIFIAYKEAKRLVYHSYDRDNSPYIDYEGGMYLHYGDYFSPDGERAQGVISTFYLAKKLGHLELTQMILEACRKFAHSQMALFNSGKNIYPFKNPTKSIDTLRDKPISNIVTMKSLRNTLAFYYRLYFAEMDV